MGDTAKGRADFSLLGDLEFESLADISHACELGRDVSSNSGLIVVQFGYDLKRALLTIPVMKGSPNRRANRVARHAGRAADHLRAAQRSFSKIPTAILKEYEEEITAARTKNRSPLNLSA